jgi:hypothetical protein
MFCDRPQVVNIDLPRFVEKFVEARNAVRRGDESGVEVGAATFGLP